MSETTRRALGLAIVLLVTGFAATPPAGALTGDANGTGDAGDTRATARSIASGHHFARIDPTDDPADWYKFTVPSVTAREGRLLIDVLLRADAPASLRLDLYGPDDADAAPGSEDDEPFATARGSGARSLRASAAVDGTWHLRIVGGTGAYEFRFRLAPENDAGQNRDAPSDAGATNAFKVTGDFSRGVLVGGDLLVGDDADVFLFDVPRANARVLATLHHPRGADLDLNIIDPLQLLEAGTKRAGEGVVTEYRDGGSAGTWAVEVLSNDDEQEASYVLAISIDGDTDAHQGSDAPATTTSGHVVGNGLFVGALSATDTVDSYRLLDVKSGDTLRVVGVSQENDVLRFQGAVELLRPDGTLAHRVSFCDQADAVTWTATAAGTWVLRVQAASRAGLDCFGLQDVDAGRYGLFVQRVRPGESGNADAPDARAGSPTVTEVDLHRGTLDRVDVADMYMIGSMERGDVARVAFATEVSGLDANVTLLDDLGQTVSHATTVDGVARIHASAARDGNHFLRVSQHVPEDEGLVEGAYRFFFNAVSNEPPIRSTLSTPKDGAGRNTVELQWTQNPDADFARYELHQGTETTFTPSAATKLATFSLRNQTAFKAIHLEAGRRYTWIVRTFDDTALFSDSNRHSITTDNAGGPLSDNADPTLSNGRVDPGEGDPSTTFVFRVTYRDGNDDPPTVKRVFIDGTPRTMETTDTKYSDGSEFRHATSLPPGQHSFFYEFDDGTTTVRDPDSGSHPGPTVTGEGNLPPRVVARATPDDGQAPLRVQFDANATDPDGDNLTYSWDFDVNDGIQNQSSQQRTTHEYESPGEYTATVTVRDTKGARSTESLSITVREVSNHPPEVDPQASPDSGLAPLSVQFTANADDPDGVIASHRWDFDNRDGLAEDATEPNPRHTYPSAGSYVATVTVTDNGGRTATGSVTVVVNAADNQAPSVSILASATSGPAPLMVNFTANGFDPDGDAITYAWDFDTSDGVTIEAEGQTASHTFPADGRYTVMVVAEDAKGAPATSTVVIEAGGAAFAQLEVRATPQEGPAPLRVAFQADTSRMMSPPASYAWDFGDGTVVDTTASPEHIFETQGAWTVRLRVTDADGALYEATTTVTATGKPEGAGTPGAAAWLVLAVVGLAAVLSRRRRA
ncbi:MAG: PKD domain-containing protein [Euryarchaeota archaeon]|nr:PKD domain-containing protein [Euryarchaeota archaeon]